MSKRFETVQRSIDLSYLFLEELLKVDFKSLDKDEKEYLFSQLETVVKYCFKVLKR